MKYFLLIALFPALSGMAQTKVPGTTRAYHYQVFARPDHTYGYTITTRAKSLIRQATGPATGAAGAAV